MYGYFFLVKNHWAIAVKFLENTVF